MVEGDWVVVEPRDDLRPGTARPPAVPAAAAAVPAVSSEQQQMDELVKAEVAAERKQRDAEHER